MPAIKKRASADVLTEIAGNPASKKSPKPVKYSDKSGGQPEMQELFNSLRSIVKPYAQRKLQEHGGESGAYSLVNLTPTEVNGKVRNELYFMGLMVQKGYVGFYFTPVYTDVGIKSEIKPELLKCLKGKSCFHIKKSDPVILAQIEEALQAGYKLYKGKGWV